MFFIAGFTVGIIDSSVHMLADGELQSSESNEVNFTTEVGNAKRFKSYEHAEGVISPIVAELMAGKTRNWSPVVVNLLTFEVHTVT